jgi:hypothetical protein
MSSITVKEPLEENLWWEGDVMYVRDTEDHVWAFKDAQIVDHPWVMDGETVISEPLNQVSFDMVLE